MTTFTRRMVQNSGVTPFKFHHELNHYEHLHDGWGKIKNSDSSSFTLHLVRFFHRRC